MREVAADADALLMSFRRSPVAARVAVAEADPVMGVIANRLHAPPARRDAAKQRPGKVRQSFYVAVAAPQKMDQHVTGQLGDFQLPRVGWDYVRQASVGDPKIIADFDQPGRRDDPRAGIAEHVDIILRRNVRRKFYLVLAQ